VCIRKSGRGIDFDNAAFFFRHRRGNVFQNEINAADVQIDNRAARSHIFNARVNFVRYVARRSAGRKIHSGAKLTLFRRRAARLPFASLLFAARKE
jgi:hypothetical protein